MTDRRLRCPSCDAPMSRVNRRGVQIDTCGDCRGVFLDRGELDRLLERAPEWQRDHDGRWEHDRERGYQRGHERERAHRGSSHHRRKSFLDEIFEFGD